LLGGGRLGDVETLLWIAAFWPFTACIVHGRELASAKRRLGVVLHAEFDSGYVNVAYCSFGMVVLALVLCSAPTLPPCALIVLSSAAMVLARYQRGGACGDAGVRSGCFSCTYADLEEWRLTGDHLRFRVGDVWRAVSLPQLLHPEVRGHLESLARGRESSFSK
jgi:hypothetical protein